MIPSEITEAEAKVSRRITMRNDCMHSALWEPIPRDFAKGVASDAWARITLGDSKPGSPVRALMLSVIFGARDKWVSLGLGREALRGYPLHCLDRPHPRPKPKCARRTRTRRADGRHNVANPARARNL